MTASPFLGLSPSLVPLRPLKKLALAGAATALFSFAGSAQGWASTIWEVDKAASKVGFIATQTGQEVPGSFSEYEAQIRFDPADLPGSSVQVIMLTDSVTTGAADRDATLKSNGMLDVSAFPEAVFTAQSFEDQGGGKYLAKGELTLRDVTQAVSLPFELSIDGQSAEAKGELPVSRLSYGVGQGQWADTSMVADEVTVTFHIKANVAN